MNVERSAERSLPAKRLMAHYSSKHEFIKAEVKKQETTRKHKGLFSGFSNLNVTNLFPEPAEFNHVEPREA